MTSSNFKVYPSSTPALEKIFGFPANSHEKSLTSEAESAPNLSELPVKDLPIEKKIAELHSTGHVSAHGTLAAAPFEFTPAPEAFKPKRYVKIAKVILPYLIVFNVALVAYFFFFKGMNFNLGSIFNSAPKPASVQESAIALLEKQDLANYQAWVSNFYFNVSDPKVLDPNVDNSGNGLSNFQKYLLNLNPKAYDTIGLGMADSQALEAGIDPTSGAPLSTQQKDIIAKYFDMEVIANRLAVEQLSRAGLVAGSYTSQPGVLTPRVAYYPKSTPTPTPAPTAVKDNVLGNILDINTDIPGRLEIPSLKINVPIIWSKDTKSFDKDLKSGVVHYPGTALPGEIGTSYISGHSSNYAWVQGNYNRIFSKLNDIADFSSFKVTVVQKNGKDAILNYVVKSRKQYSATDQEQFANTGKSVMALSTCWPVGTTAKRLVVFGELTQIDR